MPPDGEQPAPEVPAVAGELVQVADHLQPRLARDVIGIVTAEDAKVAQEGWLQAGQLKSLYKVKKDGKAGFKGKGGGGKVTVRTGQKIDADTAKQLSLGLGHISVSGADQHVHSRHAGNEPEGERRQRLNTAESDDHVGRIGQRGIGNRIRHGYDTVNPAIIWNMVQDHLPPVRTAVAAMKALATTKSPNRQPEP